MNFYKKMSYYSNNFRNLYGKDRKDFIEKNFQVHSKSQSERFVKNTSPIRLNKYLANAGICSRRKADEHIQGKLVKVNGKVITKLGVMVNCWDKILFHDKPIQSIKKIYVLLNKPKNCITTTHDQHGRPTVLDLVKKACTEPIFPVGRLDRNTTGVLLLTNDGDLSDKLTHPSYIRKKIYHVWLNKELHESDMKKLYKGVFLDNEKICVDNISYATEEDKTQIGVEIHSGKNRVIRRLFETLAYRVLQLDRVYFAGLTKKKLKRGQWRFLSKKEINFLYKRDI